MLMTLYVSSSLESVTLTWFRDAEAALCLKSLKPKLETHTLQMTPQAYTLKIKPEALSLQLKPEAGFLKLKTYA